jgi:hypothetical protein
MNQILRNFLVGYGSANNTGAEIGITRSTPLDAKQRLLFLGYGRGFFRRGRLAEVAA